MTVHYGDGLDITYTQGEIDRIAAVRARRRLIPLDRILCAWPGCTRAVRTPTQHGRKGGKWTRSRYCPRHEVIVHAIAKGEPFDLDAAPVCDY